MKNWLAYLFLVTSSIVGSSAADVDILIAPDPLGFPKAVPVTVTGFPPEIDRILKFDLSFMGFEVVSDKSGARFLIQKNASAGVGAQVTDPLANKIPYNKAFSGPSVRQQIHALADDLAKT